MCLASDVESEEVHPDPGAHLDVPLEVLDVAAEGFGFSKQKLERAPHHFSVSTVESKQASTTWVPTHVFQLLLPLYLDELLDLG